MLVQKSEEKMYYSTAHKEDEQCQYTRITSPRTMNPMTYSDR